MSAPRNVVLRGDCLEVMRTLPADSVDAVVTDPPYELGFMGKSWDSAGVSFNSATWAEALRVLKPGGHLLAFGGSRTYHRIAVAIEDAGFEIRDSLMWIYGSGFPKSHNLKGDWEGWGTALKPSHEPIVLARKPLIGTVAENVLAYGTGALNIDASRIGTDAIATHLAPVGTLAGGPQGRGARRDEDGNTMNQTHVGRWPANTLWDEKAAAILDAQSGISKSGAAGKKGSSGFADGYDGEYTVPYGDTGGASRFFYVAKPGKRERNAGLDGFPEQDTYSEASATPMRDQRKQTSRTNTHPTVKPIALMRYLIKLVTPPGGVVLDPFLGSGSTACAARLEGFDYIGIEMTPEYADIAEARIAHWKEEAE